MKPVTSARRQPRLSVAIDGRPEFQYGANAEDAHRSQTAGNSRLRPITWRFVIELLRALATAPSDVVIDAPGRGEGFWAGGPSSVLADGSYWLAYRLRRPVDQGRGYANVVARSDDGLRFEPVATVTSDQFSCASLERPALVQRPDGGWRLYVSCSTLGSKHWWVEALDADTPAGLAEGTSTVVLPGDDNTAWKDVVVLVDDDCWRMWACRHPLEDGPDRADRMTTWYASSEDGLRWEMHGPALAPQPDTWDARGARIAAVVPRDGRWWAIYDGRRSAEENWRERSGLAVGHGPDRFSAVAGPVPERAGTALRYTSLVTLDDGYRLYYEATGPDGAHDLRTVYVPRPSGESQSL